MKIIVMNSADLRIEVLNVPDHLLEEDIEVFLAEHDYSLNNISWMAAPIDYVPVQFHDFGISLEQMAVHRYLPAALLGGWQRRRFKTAHDLSVPYLRKRITTPTSPIRHNGV